MRRTNQKRRVELHRAGHAHHRHVTGKFLAQQANGMVDARRAGNGRRIVERTAKEHAARAQRKGLADIAATAHAAVYHDRAIPEGLEHARQHAQRRRGAVELPAAMVRNDDAVHAILPGKPGVGGIQDPLDDHRAAPARADRPRMLPGEMATRREIPQDAGRHDRGAVRREGVLEVGHAMSGQCAEKHAEQPARVRNAIPCQTHTRAQRRGKPRADVVFTICRRRGIDGDDQCLETGGGDPVDQRINLRLLARQVRLEPGSRRRGRDLLHPDQGRTAHDRRDSGALRGLGQDDIAAIGRKGRDPHRGNAERRAIAVPEEFDVLRARGDVGQDARGQFVRGVGLAIGAQRLAVLARAADVAINWPRQATCGEPLEILQAEHLGQHPGRSLAAVFLVHD